MNIFINTFMRSFAKFLIVPTLFLISILSYNIIFPIDYPPIKITYRTSLILGSEDKVIRVCNTSMKKLRCFATIGDDIKYEFDLMPNSYQEIGSEQVGRNFQQGEQGAVSVEGSFFPVKINVMGSHE